MNLRTQVIMYVLCATATENIETSSISSVIDLLSEISDTMQNLWWLVALIFTILVLVFSLFSIRRKANKYTRKVINRLIDDGKYIPGVFVELNDTKEVLRYFVYSKKWKKRLIEGFNFVYDNAYGDILRKACDNTSACFHLGRGTSQKDVMDAVNTAYDLHNNFRKSEVEFKPDYEESKVLFEILHYPYTEALGSLVQYCKAANEKYFILTGSAGNGKTNLLCSISELLINLKEATIFLNSRDIEGEVLDFIISQLELPQLYVKHKELYLYMVNILLTIQHKHLFIIIDAINENDSDNFGSRIATFINIISGYSRVKVIVSCRNEYYKERFRECLVDKVDVPSFEFDLKEQQYTIAAIRQMIRAYSKHFNYSGNISPAVQNMLSEQLLLLRIFFEVNKGSDADVFSIRKHEIYAQYIEVIKRNSGEYIVKVLNTVADFMIENENYDDISLSDLEKAGITPDVIKKAVDSSILLSKKLISHEGTIARNESEVVYFVFDEMRDYYLARRILLKNISADNVDGESVLEKLKQLKAIGASCAEGVIHYCYVFFRTDEVVEKLGQTEKMCNAILDLYRIPESREKMSYWHMHHREEFQNLGLRIILTSGIALTDFEIAYIQDCLRKDPYEDGGIIFDTMLDGTLYGGIYNLDIYLDILLGLKNEDAIINAFHTICTRNAFEECFIPKDFISYYDKLADSEHKLQIQRIAELFLLCFELHDSDTQEELEDFFYNLPTHDKVKNEMILKMRVACGSEVSDYE
ncbi:MAG: NACHT domain-containing protein [Lachnospiraceae bacterium]|nr:NACHT domain-containing protein [Lachnospiraceae bacterium]